MFCATRELRGIISCAASPFHADENMDNERLARNRPLLPYVTVSLCSGNRAFSKEVGCDNSEKRMSRGGLDTLHVDEPPQILRGRLRGRLLAQRNR